MHDKVLILDCGSQYTQLIARRVRELNVFCEIIPFNKITALGEDVKAVIISGSPFSVNDQDAPQIDLNLFIYKVPVLAICYGAQYLAKQLGGKVENSTQREYGKASILILEKTDPIFKGISDLSQVWMSHGDSVLEVPNDYTNLAETQGNRFTAFRSNEDTDLAPVYGIQFHPEVTHTSQGEVLLQNFLLDIARIKPDWTPGAFIEESIAQIKQTVGQDKVILALSGGVDSTVAARLIHEAIGQQLLCIFINNGLLRKNEFEEVLESYKNLNLNVLGIDAKELFYEALSGVEDPETKRKAIGKGFIDVFEAEAKKREHFKWLAQGTIYPDVIESINVHGPSVTIKSHHNVGGLPDKLNLKILEPLRMLFKDEVRKVGKALGLEGRFVGRHPFPGPGLGIRILGEVTPDKVKILQEVDDLFIKGLKENNLYDQVWQAGAILLPVKSVGVMGDERTYENTVALRAVTSVDGMTAEWARLPHEFLAAISNQIVNNVRGVNRVVYDITSKPPATIEWE